MHWLHKLLEFIRDPGALLVYGYWAIALVIFLETGAMVFFLPGDSLLVVAGVYAAKGTTDVNILYLNLLLIPAAILGDATSYWIGRKIGPALFRKKESRFFKPSHVEAAHAFYEKHGGIAIVLARFMPLVRTFVPVVAGVGGMSYRKFATYNIIGGAAWVASMTSLGYFLGSRFPWVGKRIEIVIVVVVLVSITPGIYAWWKSRRNKAKAAT